MRKQQLLGIFPIQSAELVQFLRLDLKQLLQILAPLFNLFSAPSALLDATALLDLEPRLRRIKGCTHLPLLRQAMRAKMKTETKKAA